MPVPFTMPPRLGLLEVRRVCSSNLLHYLLRGSVTIPNTSTYDVALLDNDIVNVMVGKLWSLEIGMHQ